MRTIKLLGLALMATLAFSAVGALGAGSASALLFLTLNGGELLFEVKSLNFNPQLLTVGNHTVTCKSLLGRGAILNKTDEARKIRLTFHECESGGFACNSANEPSGLITTLLLDALLVTLLLVPPLDKYALKLLSEEKPPHLASFTCGLINVVVQGSVVGDFEETLEQSQTDKKEAKLLFNDTVQQHFWTLKGIGTAKLEANVGLGFEAATEDALVDIISGGVTLCHN